MHFIFVISFFSLKLRKSKKTTVKYKNKNKREKTRTKLLIARNVWVKLMNDYPREKKNRNKIIYAMASMRICQKWIFVVFEEPKVAKHTSNILSPREKRKPLKLRKYRASLICLVECWAALCMCDTKSSALNFQDGREFDCVAISSE